MIIIIKEKKIYTAQEIKDKEEKKAQGKELDRALDNGEADREVYNLLDNMIDELGEAGVDVSCFGHRARMVLVKYAKKLTYDFSAH